jgi:hypothetical protein
MTDLQLSSLFINQLLTMGLPAVDQSLMKLLEAMETFPKSAVLFNAVSIAKTLGLLLALCMGSYECWMMMLGRRGMDVMKLLRIAALSICITTSSYICSALKAPGKGLETTAMMMAQAKNREVAALELKVAEKQAGYLKRLREVQDSIETAKQVQAIGEDAHIAQGIRSFLSHFKIRERIDRMNQWAEKHKKRTIAITIGVLTLSLILGSWLTFSSDSKEPDLFGGMTDVRPDFEGMRRIQRLKSLQVEQTTDLTNRGQRLKRDLDSLIAIPVKSHKDSVDIMVKYRQLEIVMDYLDNKQPNKNN